MSKQEQLIIITWLMKLRASAYINFQYVQISLGKCSTTCRIFPTQSYTELTSYLIYNDSHAVNHIKC